jgi:hypothetical protein
LEEVIVVILPDPVPGGAFRPEGRINETGVVPHFFRQTRVPAFAVVPALSVEDCGSPRDRDLEVVSVIRDTVVGVYHLGIIRDIYINIIAESREKTPFQRLEL